MGAVAYSFIDILGEDEEDEEDEKILDQMDPPRVEKIVIPMVQRDYAQGRLNSEVTPVRKRFVDALYKAVTEYKAVTDTPILLDFIYGDIDKDGIMTPLDGQQRLTALFLLHWYAVINNNIAEDEYGFLKNFSYETRLDARDFCRALVDCDNIAKFQRQSGKDLPTLSAEIKNQVWFPRVWNDDPTISSMLVMLDEIHNKFKGKEELWNKLNEGCVKFYFLPIKNMGLTDELYIRMNSRGRRLTSFEIFKAELEGTIFRIDQEDQEMARRISRKIDCEWTDLLWKYCNFNNGSSEDNLVDDLFLNYFKFIFDVISYLGNASESGDAMNSAGEVDVSDLDIFGLLEKYFSSKCSKQKSNIKIMEEFFDCWCDIPDFDSPEDFLQSFMAENHEDGKIVYGDKIFENCLKTYREKNKFSNKDFVLLYAIITYLCERDNIEERGERDNIKIKEGAFRRRIRIVNNLIQNSEVKKKNMPAILKQIKYIICKGKIGDSNVKSGDSDEGNDDWVDNGFNDYQLKEEKSKIEFLEEHPDKKGDLFRLEDHRLLKGRIGIIGLENLEYAKRFESLFKCCKDKIDCAMMTFGNYGVAANTDNNPWIYQYGSSENDEAWFNLFHLCEKSGFDNARKALCSLLETNEEFSDKLLAKISEDYLSECENKSRFPFEYYYIKYPSYRLGYPARLGNGERNEKPYMFLVLESETRSTKGSYFPYLKEAAEKVGIGELSDYNSKEQRQTLNFRNQQIDQQIECKNDSYILTDKTDERGREPIDIPQENGVDTEDRVKFLQEFIKDKWKKDK